MPWWGRNIPNHFKMKIGLEPRNLPWARRYPLELDCDWVRLGYS